MKQTEDIKTNIFFWVFLFIYSIIVIFRLGSHEVPQTSWYSNEKGKEIILDFGEKQDISGFVYYLGNYENRMFSIDTADDESMRWEKHGSVEMSQVYQWGIKIINLNARYIKLTTKKVYTQLNELLFFDRAGQVVRPVNLYDYPELFDEEILYEGGASYKTGTIFDEPVYARTAYEYIQGIRSYEDTHPPMGKILISFGIMCLGMNPFGWRIMGAISLILIVLMIWKFGRRLFENPWIPLCISVIFAFDFLPFTHSRMAQVDSFLVLFILLMSYFMYLYGECIIVESTKEIKINKQKTIIYMLLAGICMGCAVSCKWSAFYGAIGALFIGSYFTITALRKKTLQMKDFKDILLISPVAFVIIPICIYAISYIPYISIDPTRSFLEELILNQINMFRYHTQLNSVHPFSSKWYQWPLIGGCITYFTRVTKDIDECIVLLGNPVFWFSGLAALFYSIYDIWVNNDRKGILLLILYLFPLLPWILISRTSFLYHYFPCLPALALLLGFCAERHGTLGIKILKLLGILAVFMFIIYYPILSGGEISFERLMMLEWLPWWNFLGI